MSNVLDIEPLLEIARRASTKIGDPTLAERFIRIAVQKLLRDPRALRPATTADLTNAPDWARVAFVRGEDLSVYRSNPALAARLNVVARQLADTRAVAATEWTQHPDDSAVILDAILFLKKFDRVDFETAAHKAHVFSRVFESWREDDTKPQCDPQSLVLLSGQVWHRVNSVAELRRVGVEFRNCLGRTTSNRGYGACLRRGKAQFWVLRDLNGNGLMVAMAPAPRATYFQEVKGPGNARIRAEHPALIQLGIAIGVRPSPPRPPRPPRLATRRVLPLPAILPAIAETRMPCRCMLCDPRLRLRQTIAAP